MNKTLKVITILLLGFVGTSGIYGQTISSGFIIKGKVIEEQTDNNLQYVNVAVFKDKDSSLVTGSITDAHGKFNIPIKNPGNYYLTIDFIGYDKIYTSNFQLNPGNKIFDAGTVVLKQSRIGINEVEVVAERPFVTYHLDKKVVDVSLNPSAQGGTAVDALENVPSIQTNIEGEVTLRGSSSFTVLIDGRQTPLTGTDALNQIPASAIQKIEIITNPSVKYDPDGTTGIINIISKKNSLLGHSMVVNTSVGTSPMYSADLTYAYRMKKITFNAGVNYRNHHHDNFGNSNQYTSHIDTVTNEVDSITNLYKKRDGKRQFQVYSIKGGIDYELFEGNVASVMLSYNNFTFERGNGTNISQINPSYNTYRHSLDGFKTDPENWQINIGDKHIFNENQDHYFKFDAMYQSGKADERNWVESYMTDENWARKPFQDSVGRKTSVKGKDLNYRVELDYMRPIGKNFIVEAGYTLRIDQKEQGYEYFINSVEPDDWSVVPELYDTANYKRTINAGWALFKGKVLGINISGGLRIENTDRHVETEKDNYEFNYNYLGWYPSFAISKEFSKGDVIQGSYSRRINRPRPWHLSPFPRLSDGYTQYEPNPELEPEYTNSWEVNFQKSLGGMSFLSLETFYHYTTNKIERLDIVESDTLTVSRRENLDYDKRYGAELGGHVKLSSWFSFQPGFSIYYYETEGEVQGENRKINDISYDGRLTTNFILPTKTRIQLMGFYRGPEVEISEEQQEMYWMSAAVRQEFLNRKLNLTVRVDDIFSTRKRLDSGHYGNTTIYSEGYRKSPTFVVSLSYRLNQSEKRNGNGPGGGNDGGMDMDY